MLDRAWLKRRSRARPLPPALAPNLLTSGRRESTPTLTPLPFVSNHGGSQSEEEQAGPRAGGSESRILKVEGEQGSAQVDSHPARSRKRRTSEM